MDLSALELMDERGHLNGFLGCDQCDEDTTLAERLNEHMNLND
jgi:hypothetical protein